MHAEVARANLYFHHLIERDPARARRELDAINTALARDGGKFGGAPLRIFFKPDLITERERKAAQVIVRHVMNVLEKTVQLYFADPRAQTFFRINDHERALAAIEPRYRRCVNVARLDGFVSNGAVKFLEFNCDSPAGMGYIDLTERHLFSTEVFRDFNARFAIAPTDRLGMLLFALLECWRQAGGVTRPTIAIVDWAEASTYSEFELCARYFAAQGFHTFIADPRELEFTGGVLTVGGAKIDFVYRRVLTKEVAARMDECRALVSAARAGAVVMANPFRARLLSNKAVMAIYSDTDFDHCFTPTENVVKRAFLPWTALLIEQKVRFRGREEDLLGFVDRMKDLFVIKSASGHGGKEVVIGRESSPAEWRAALQKVLAAGDWVVQEYVEVPETYVPTFEGDRLLFAPKKINVNPYAFGGRWGGALSRLSESSIINVSLGGGVVPVIACRER
ncbi:MAG: circularly permuted type 2 ATP-grasp protein [Planctomycetes bacterium]|nr:circularly permuted type 2 ATP-grasp protein [Planctomycetota bacterium]